MNDNKNSSLTIDKVHSIRKDFFNRLEQEWSRPPERIDSIMGQSQFYIPPEEIKPLHQGYPENELYSSGGERVFDVEHGLLLRSFLVETDNMTNGSSKTSTRLSQASVEEKLQHLKSIQSQKSNTDSEKRILRFFYSILQAGDWLRFGILIRGDQRSHNVLNSKRQMELERIWDRPADAISRGPDVLLIEWRFIEPDFYNNYAIQERFTQIARHLHFCLGKAIYRHLNGFDEEDSQIFKDMDGVDGGRVGLYHQE